MNTYRFAPLPSNSSVAAAVTVAVCAWFLVAGAAIVADTPRAGMQAVAASAPAAPLAVAAAPSPEALTPVVVIVPEARLRIVVEGRRA